MSHEKLTSERESLRETAYALLDCIERSPPDADAVARLKWSLGRRLNIHLLNEDRLIVAAVKSAQAAGRTVKAHETLGATARLAEEYRDYLATWTADRLQRDWPEFRRATRSLVGALCQRLDEDAEAFAPLVEEATLAKRA